MEMNGNEWKWREIEGHRRPVSAGNLCALHTKMCAGDTKMCAKLTLNNFLTDKRFLVNFRIPEKSSANDYGDLTRINHICQRTQPDSTWLNHICQRTQPDSTWLNHIC